MQVHTPLRASGHSHPGLLRENNEDRFHSDPARGFFVVIDGVGGQAAGEKAAETALAKIRERLEEGIGPDEARIREAITRANNEIYRLANLRPEWKGMACVLTVVVVDGSRAIVGHVGDTRLYKVRGRRIEKLTKDHSPVGEREDAGQMSELDAMRHPRRNEVYRDVGSERHDANDPDFIDTFRVGFENDAALLLCSDGLTDLVPSETIREMIEQFAGHPYEVARALVDAANDAGGKDNVTVVYVEGSRFADGEDTGAVRRRPVLAVETRRELETPPATVVTRVERRGTVVRALRLAAIILLLGAVIGWSLYQRGDFRFSAAPSAEAPSAGPVIVVAAGASISEAIARAGSGTKVLVEPGEYRERLRMKTGVDVQSRVPRGASIRLPGTASEAAAAIVFEDVSDVELRGFRILGDAATPLGTGVSVERSDAVLSDIEISGARGSAVVFGAGASGALLGSEIHGNSGAAVTVRTGGAPRIAHNTFARNATSEKTAGVVLIEAGGRPDIRRNVFVGVVREAVVGAPGVPAGSIATENWFLPSPSTAKPPRGRSNGRGRE
jgi:serine/threonine protein phosphatase PrpC